jgi:hypothetical protein
LNLGGAAAMRWRSLKTAAALAPRALNAGCHRASVMQQILDRTSARLGNRYSGHDPE